ncbi:MAG: 4Fe-4S dicluster domain-containing protein [Phycisphaera sp.]|nr:4Fe-4S dicluster domain-containing protein [Phycisphaera sp.]
MSDTTPTTRPPKRIALELDPRTYRQAELCVHCGLCLPACPTYTENGLEADSPRGRIYLMKAMADGRIEPTDKVLTHLDKCLDCRACETACPSGVVYHELIEEQRARQHGLREKRRGLADRIIDWICLNVMTRPARLRLAVLPPRLLQKIGMWRPTIALMRKLLGPKLGKMQQMLPQRGGLWPKPLDERYDANPQATIEKKLTVGLMAGCVGSVLFDDVNRRTVELLTHLGCDVAVPRTQDCCGAIHHHGGDPDGAAERAKHNIEAFGDCDIVVNNIAGCGAMLKEYDHLLRDDSAWAERAKAFSAKTRDISELIVELDPPSPPHRVELTVTYHDACHLAHGQKITKQPRQLLSMIDGLRVVPLPEADMCCGAAGTYNLQQPEMAADLGERKAKHIASTGATVCVTGNVGCAMQILSESQRCGLPVQVMHPVDLLHRAYLGA